MVPCPGEEAVTVSKYSRKFDYEGLHAFVFIDHIDPGVNAADVVGNLFRLESESGRVLWASTFVGDYVAFAHIQVDDTDDDKKSLAALQDFIEGDLWRAGVHCKFAVEVPRPDKVGIKRDTPELIALVGIRTKPGRAIEVADALEEVEGFKGCSVVLGDLDVVLQLTADSLEDLIGNILSIQGSKGIVSTSTAIADGSRGPFS